MRLEARVPKCWSDLYVLKLDEVPWGEFRGRWFSEKIDVQLIGRRRLCFKKTNWLGSRLELIEDPDGPTLASADRAGAFTSAWKMTLTSGPARLVSAGWFNTRFRVLRGGTAVAEVDRVGVCRQGWVVHGSLEQTDALFIGLIYHTIVRRAASSAATPP